MTSNVTKLETNVNVPDTLISDLEQINERIESLKKSAAEKREKILAYFKAEMDSQLSGKDYGCGTVNVESQSYKLKIAIGKRVEWDGELLEKRAAEIANSGRDPKEYMDVKYSVSENAYKNWPSEIREFFEPARTVKVSAPTVSYERKE